MAFAGSFAVYAAVPALLWSSVVYLVQSVGILMVLRHYSSPPRTAVSPNLPEDKVPRITIIRPVKGLEPELYACLASTFRQDYPKSKFSVRLCVSSEDDPAYPVLEQVVEDFSGAGFDIRLLVEEYDPLISSLDGKIGQALGPNPKIRNISRAYRESRPDDLIWIIDCNVWVARGVAGRMVDRLMGFLPDGATTKPFRFVHHMPLVVDIPTVSQSGRLWTRLMRLGGGRLDEMFMATTHAKFYGAINTVGIAPCIIGKSNMFRRAHLDTYTDPTHNPNLPASDAVRGRGINFFSRYICEDHLIGDLLWKAPIPDFPGRHGLVWGDLAIQPVASTSVPAYCARRVRWLRARKWTVLLATLVEPGVESLLCNLLFAYAATTLPFFPSAIPRSWSGMIVLWGTGLAIWMACDRLVFRRLHAGRTVDVDEDTPAFARGSEHGGVAVRSFVEWLPAWVAREVLALPIWMWAVLLGTTLSWRGRTFHVHRDMSVVELKDKLNKSNKAFVQSRRADAANQHGCVSDHPEIQDAPRWKARPGARHRATKPNI